MRGWEGGGDWRPPPRWARQRWWRWRWRRRRMAASDQACGCRLPGSPFVSVFEQLCACGPDTPAFRAAVRRLWPACPLCGPAPTPPASWGTCEGVTSSSHVAGRVRPHLRSLHCVSAFPSLRSPPCVRTYASLCPTALHACQLNHVQPACWGRPRKFRARSGLSAAASATTTSTRSCVCVALRGQRRRPPRTGAVGLP